MHRLENTSFCLRGESLGRLHREGDDGAEPRRMGKMRKGMPGKGNTTDVEV